MFSLQGTKLQLSFLWNLYNSWLFKNKFENNWKIPFTCSLSVSPLQESLWELVIHALSVGRTLQCRSVRTVNRDPGRALPRKLFGCHHLLRQLLSPSEGAGRRGEQPAALSGKRTEHCWPPPLPEMGCIQQAITLQS